jgi:subtilisin family serine protease
MQNDREILSMSFGADSMPDTVHGALDDAYAAGHLLVAAAGNDDNNEDGDCEEANVGQPARHEDVIAVSAMDSDDTLAGYSSVGPEVELMGPGTDVRSTYKGDSYETLSGTSMACPHVTGVGALVWGANEYGDPDPGERDNVRSTLQDTAETVVESCEEGYGLVNAASAVE